MKTLSWWMYLLSPIALPLIPIYILSRLFLAISITGLAVIFERDEPQWVKETLDFIW